MKNPLLFSIVIPTYNREKFIENTLESVFAQSYSHYEVIVVDNCSTDKTEEILAPYLAEGKIRFIKHDRNYERSRSRNTGMENANGDFLTFLDSDDFMYPDNLRDAAEFIKQNPELKVFQNLYELVDAERNVIQKYKLASITDQYLAIANGNFMACIGDFIDKDIYSNYRFDTFPNLTGGEDWEFWIRVLADHKVGRLEKYNSGVLQHGERSINNQSVETMDIGSKYMVEKFRNDPHLSKVYAAYLDRIEANSFLYLNLLSNDGRLRCKAYYYLWTAFKKDKSVFFTMRFLRSLRRTMMNFG